MRHDHRLEGEAFRLRPLTTDDAAFIVELRTDEARNRYLNPTSPSLADQVAWTERYFEREDDVYFVIERTGSGASEGAVALYDIEPGRQAQWGRWILRPGSLAAPESALLIYRFAFETLGLPRVYCRTEAGNTAVIGFHESCGLATAGPVGTAIEQAVTAAEWPDVAARLAQGASRSAALLRRRGG